MFLNGYIDIILGVKMKYSPKKIDTSVRIIYFSMLFASVSLMMINSSGLVRTILYSVALILLAVSVFFFIKYDATSYEYILIERNGTLDFYVNKITGRRGAYVVYYPITDCVKMGKYERELHSELKGQYKDLRVGRYVQNFISSKERFYLVFQNKDGYYDAIVFEANDKMVEMLSAYFEKAKNEAQSDFSEA